jgi:hypothetical protein
MNRIMPTSALAAITLALVHATAAAQDNRPRLHVNDRWKECSFQLDPALGQPAWHQFTEEAGLVVYFRSLADARPMGRRKFELSLLQWETGIDDRSSAWNDTFVHPDSAHWLFEGSRLKFPGLLVRAGVTDRTDVGVYLAKNFNANYGFFGGQLQRNLLDRSAWAASARGSFVSMFGPADIDFIVYGVDLLASRRTKLSRRVALSPYVGVSSYLASAHEKSSVVALSDERVLGAHGSVGAAVEISKARLAVEFGVARVRSLSFKLGVGR